MAYPKPLSEKSLEKLYKEAGLTDEQCSFLHTLFAACANLYGAITMRGVWNICQQLKEAPKLRRKDLLTFSSIARREVQPYYVFEIEELYEDEPHNELDRHIVHKDLIGNGYGKLNLFYDLMDQLDEKPYCLPDDLLSYAAPKPSAVETALYSFLSDLRSTTDECKPKYGLAIPNDHKGKMLNEFSFLNADERFEVEWLKKRPTAQAAYLEDLSGTEAEKIMRLYKRAENLGRMNPMETMQWMIDELNEAGVEITQGQIEELLKLMTDYHNNNRLWCVRGWTPHQLAKLYHSSGPTAITFGPGLQRAFADGAMNKDELVRKMRELGLEVLG